MPLPEPIPASAHDESFAGVTYHIRGELVPELQIDIDGQQVMFEHHTLLWKETQLDIELKKLPGGSSARLPAWNSSSRAPPARDASPSRATRPGNACRCTSAREKG